MLHNKISWKRQSFHTSINQEASFWWSCTAACSQSTDVATKKLCLAPIFVGLEVLFFFLNFYRPYVDSCHRQQKLICWLTKDFYNSPEWSMTKVYLSGDTLIERVAIHSLLCMLGTGNKSTSQEAMHAFYCIYSTWDLAQSRMVS